MPLLTELGGFSVDVVAIDMSLLTELDNRRLSASRKVSPHMPLLTELGGFSVDVVAIDMSLLTELDNRYAR
jgi:hypothetical protein